ncbi:expressed unknown protein [Seminavis robusta]|uniref:Uncharacterized protein n=1 Tax=Seminavis robusta TaxID=568900 RepID=A0A9N8DK07_9STRA|nr:expressed unknown protein [Seminavis robusta]|eukprot:Sro184_g079860.1 n/a (295) ;mRNA; f:25332-26216
MQLLLSTIIFLWMATAGAQENATSGQKVCQSTSDCSGGEYCASGLCALINCANWAVSTPAGEMSFSEEPCIAEGAEEGEAFCGTDGSCYEYTCENWYQFGPAAFTGYDTATVVELQCDDYADGAAENQNSVVFGCRPYQPGSKAPEAKTWTHFFNQKCSAKTPSGSDFSCYQNKPNTDYRDFQGELARLNLNSCDRDLFDNEQPLYWYIVQMQHTVNKVTTKFGQGRDNTASGSAFDASAADKTMFAHLNDGTFVAGEETDSGSSSSSSASRRWSRNNLGWGIIMVAGAALFLS